MSDRCSALPSGQSAYDMVQGDPGSFGRVVACTFGRATLIGLGMYAGGKRKNLVHDALAGALGIEAFVIVWALWRNRA